ncbi:PIN domain-containing protein [Streptomyces sp. NPDC091412]|uniref:PIN domain-containing protein n=1 Tax=Streptomyces sp. NPDC091412 TaxID=3366002 RepID=UPI0038045040
MIILDTSILRSFSPESSSADLLRTIKAVGREGVAAPWMVIEELAAQQAIKYEEIHQRAAQAVEALRQGTPWGLDVQLCNRDTERIRDHWRQTWGQLLGVIPTSDDALRQALFREANLLPPCKDVKGHKTGSRDAAIWLSAVEYAQKHPDETVYFVSANTKDFGDGTPYPYPMNKDVAGMADRFVQLTSMDDLASHFTEPAEVDGALVIEILKSETVLRGIKQIADAHFPFPGPLECTAPMPDGTSVVVEASTWLTDEAHFGSVSEIVAYRIGDHVWCTASVEWHIVGTCDTLMGTLEGAVDWPTAVLFSLSRENPRLAVLREAPPRPVDEAALAALNLELPNATMVELATAAARAAAQAGRLPRAYSGALVRRALRQQMRLGDTSPG